MPKYVMRYGVKHGVGNKVWDLPAGAECPAEILKDMQKLGHVEEYRDRAPTAPPVASVSKRVTQPAPKEPAEEDGDIEPEKETKK